MGEEAAACSSLSDRPQKRARNDYTATNAYRQKANDSNSDKNETDDADSDEPFGNDQKGCPMVEVTGATSTICHEWLVNAKRWPREAEDCIRQFMEKRQYFYFRRAEAANVAVFKELFSLIRSRAIKKGWTKEDDGRLTRKLITKINNVRIALVAEGKVRDTGARNFARVERNETVPEGSSSPQLENLLHGISELSEVDTMVVARAVMTRVGDEMKMVQILLSAMENVRRSGGQR